MDGVLTPLHATVVKPIPVEGFLFTSGGEAHEGYNGFICKIIGREDPDGEDLLPAFLVRFGDGTEFRAWGEELSPWYPT